MTHPKVHGSVIIGESNENRAVKNAEAALRRGMRQAGLIEDRVTQPPAPRRPKPAPQPRITADRFDIAEFRREKIQQRLERLRSGEVMPTAKEAAARAARVEVVILPSRRDKVDRWRAWRLAVRNLRQAGRDWDLIRALKGRVMRDADYSSRIIAVYRKALTERAIAAAGEDVITHAYQLQDSLRLQEEAEERWSHGYR
jgi:hypothetical protein